jgi:uncharacterized membrane protein HdeD (DUF308 family)
MTDLKTTISNALKHWYLPLIAGILFIVFGGYIFTIPLTAYLTLAVLFSAIYFVSGVIDIYFAISNKDILDGWGWYLVSGILTFLLGAYLMINPDVTMGVLPYIVGFGMLFRAIQGLGFAIDLKKYDLSWGTLAFISVLGILLSFYLLANPAAGALSIVTVTALIFIVVGIFGVMLSLQLKQLPSKL